MIAIIIMMLSHYTIPVLPNGGLRLHSDRNQNTEVSLDECRALMDERRGGFSFKD